MTRSAPTEKQMKNTEVMLWPVQVAKNSRKWSNLANIIKTSNLRTKSNNNKKSVKLSN